MGLQFYHFATRRRICYIWRDKIRNRQHGHDFCSIFTQKSNHNQNPYMNIQKILLVLITTSLLSGCSTIKSRLFGISTTPIASTKPLEYDFLQPRRASLDTATVARLTSTKDYDGRFKYFSANGHECRAISADLSRTACLINGTWKESAPVLVVKIP